MIYVCIPSYNEASTVGLVLWKIRRVFEEFPREYQLLVVDDGSTDPTAEVLEPYAKALPLTVIRHVERRGYGRSVEELMRAALERSDRPKRDAAILLHADFAHNPECLPELIRRLDSGADVVVTRATIEGEPSRGRRWVRKAARFLLPGLSIPGSTDVVSGCGAIRLVCLRNAIRTSGGSLLSTEGWTANAELFARAAQQARRVDVVQTIERHDLRERPSRVDPWGYAKELWRNGRRLRIRSGPRAESSAPGSAPSESNELQEANS
ncbi:MAG TPA: glycosyltransferase family 2 protein [Gemmatimonadales bacterium]|jgi:glycosyltransferase involved in cell wall biosynthesis